MKTLSTLTLAAAITGAVAMAAAPVKAEDGKCYGISKAGENNCADAAGTHGCQGHAASDYSGQDWKLASEEDCAAHGGSFGEPFEGTNETMSGGDEGHQGETEGSAE